MQTTFFAQMRSILGVSLLAFLMLAAQPTLAASKAKTAPNPSVAQGDTEDTEEGADLSGDSLPMPAAAAPQMGMPEAAMAGDTLSNFGPSSGTVVGNRALELRDEVLRLRSSVNLNMNEFALQRSNGAAGAVQYHSTVAAITARLQNGTTRGNPILLRQWDEAEASLNEVTTSLNRLNALQSSVAADASLSGYLLESVQAAFQLSGAVDEDHDQLKLLRDEASRIIVQVDYLRNQITDDIQRQTVYLTTERSNLQSLAFAVSRGELLGNSSNRPVIVTPSPVSSMPPSVSAGPAPVPAAAPVGHVGSAALDMPPATYTGNPDVGVAPSTGRLLVLIRYNKPVVEYEQQLAQAVGTALERRPNAEFSIVAVSPAAGEPNDMARAQEVAGRNAESVKRSMVQLGLASSRIAVASTQTQTAQAPEVHVYVR